MHGVIPGARVMLAGDRSATPEKADPTDRASVRTRSLYLSLIHIFMATGGNAGKEGYVAEPYLTPNN